MNGSEAERKPLNHTEANGTEVAKVFGDFLGRAGFGGERIVILRNGKPIAALIGLPDFQRLELIDAA